MRLPDFTAEASLYRASEAYRTMGAAGLARGKEVLPAQTPQPELIGERCINCFGARCCRSCPAGTFLDCLPRGFWPSCFCRQLPR